MATTTSLTATAGSAWTLAYTAAGAVTIALQTITPAGDLLVRIGSATATGDDPLAAAEILNPRELRTFTLANGDKVHVRPLGDVSLTVILRA